MKNEDKYLVINDEDGDLNYFDSLKEAKKWAMAVIKNAKRADEAVDIKIYKNILMSGVEKKYELKKVR